MRSDAKQHAVPWTAIGMISAGYAELYRGDTPRHCSASRKYATLDNAQFLFYTGTGECRPAWFE